MRFLIPILVGTVIGLVTNGIAIRMLFRPFRPVRIGKFRLPFTPGLIPREQKRVAHSIGLLVAEELLDPETMRETLLKPSVRETFDRQIDQMAAKALESDWTLLDYMQTGEKGSAVEKGLLAVNKTVIRKITDEVRGMDVGGLIVDHFADDVIGGLNPMIIGLLGGAIDSIRDSIKNKINEIVDERAEDIITDFVDRKMDQWIQIPLSDAARKAQPYLPELKELAWEAYVRLIENKLRAALETLDLQQVVEEKIASYDVRELERLLMGLMKKELGAIVYLGGVLGAAMGFVSAFF